MTLRVFVGLLLASIFIVSMAFVGVTLMIFKEQLMQLLPLDTPGVDQALSALIAQDAAASLIVTVLLIGVVFFMLGYFVARPLRGIVASMHAFSTTGEHLPMPDVRGAPSEIQTLASTFTTFTEHVEEAHKRDMDMSRVKSDFISTAAHQFRTPLTGIRWALEALALEPLTEGQKALVQSATDKSHDLVNIVKTLLDISSIESGKYKYAFAPVDLGALAATVTRDFEPLAQKAQVSLFLEKGEAPIPRVRADQERIKWILNNLVENALTYTPAGGSVHLTMEATAERVFLHVRDTGIGIEAKDRGNIFERFYRAENAVAKQNAGNGLGLYIARTIATDHGGDLNFKTNDTGPGTTFTLSLPLAS